MAPSTPLRRGLRLASTSGCAALALSASLGACGTTEVDPPISTLDGRGDLAPDIRREDVEPLDPRMDSDRDGIVDIDELIGWEIRVDSTGRPQGIETRVVRSDPTMADTDEDGLNDGLERLSGADPNRADTDGDGLDDVYEVQRWGTSPASVDTDGDSRGPDPDPSAAPVVDLFDAAELALVPDPDAPGEMTSSVDATSPLLADTDGDARTDWEELMNGTRSATRADVPSVALRATPGVGPGIFFRTVDTSTMTTASEVTASESSSTTGVAGTTLGTTTSIAASYSSMIEAGVILEAGADVDNFGAKAGGLLNAEASFGLDVSSSLRFGLNGGATTSWGSAASEARSQVESRTHTVEGGRITLAVDLVNDGDVPFRLRNLRVEAAYRDDETGLLRPLTTLRLRDGEPADGIVIARGGSAGAILESTDVETARLLDLLTQASFLAVEASGYEVLDAGDEHYAFSQARVSERTSTLSLEGSSSPRVVRIATNVRRDVNGREVGLSVAEVLEAIGVAFMAEPITNPENPFQQYVYEIEGERTLLHDGAAPDLADPPYPSEIQPGPRLVRRGWFAMFRRRDGSVEFAENLLTARLLPGDRVSLVFTEDQDRDGLCAIEEAALGTSDMDIDSDDDGLSDFFETRVGWNVAVTGQPVRHVFSPPRQADVDGDGLSDRQEMLRLDPATGYFVGTRPTRADTDRDGIGDAVEVANPDDDLDPLHFDDPTASPVMCHRRVLTARRRSEPYQVWYRVQEEEVDLTAVVIRFLDGSEQTFRHEPGRVLTGHVLHSVPASSLYGVKTTGGRTPVQFCDEGDAL
jgi:hypothetical protein